MNTAKEISSLSIEYADSKLSIKLINDVQKTIFGDDALDVSKDIELWEQYRHGMTFIKDPKDGMVKAFMGLWPVKEEAYQSLKSGVITDNGVNSKDISGKADSPHWWIGSLYVESQFSETYPSVAAYLVYGTFMKWLCLSQATQEIKIISTGWSPEGRTLLIRYGFVEVSTQEYPIYVFESGILRLLKKLNKLGRRFNPTQTIFLNEVQ